MTASLEQLLPTLIDTDPNAGHVSFSRTFKEVHREAEIARNIASSLVDGRASVGYRIWGITRKKRKVSGTAFDPYAEFKDGANYAQYLEGALRPSAQASFQEGLVGKKRIVVMRIELIDAHLAPASPDAPSAPAEEGHSLVSDLEWLVAKASERRRASASLPDSDSAEYIIERTLRGILNDAIAKSSVTRSDSYGAGSTRTTNATCRGPLDLRKETPSGLNASAGWFGAATDDLNKAYALDLLDWQSLYRSLSLPIPEESSSILDQLERMKLITTSGDAVRITNLGALAMGRDLRAFDALDRLAIQIVIYRGAGRAEAVATRRFDTGYAESIDAACFWINAHFESEPLDAKSPAMPYPAAALREIIANAAAHQDIQLLDRSVQSDLVANAFLLNSEFLPGAGPLVEVFSDRIEVSNVGGLNVPLAQIANDSIRDNRNPLTQLLRYFRNRPIPRSGWGAVLESCDMHRSPIPTFNEPAEELALLEFAQSPEASKASGAYTLANDPDAQAHESRVRVTLRPITAFKDLTPEQRLIATYWHAFNRYAHGDYLTNGSLRERFGMEESNSAQVSRLIKDASKHGLIRVVDPEAAPKFKKYVPYWA